MAAPDHNIFDNNRHHYDLDHWDCPICFKTISSSRPPVYNADNCSCASLGNFTNGRTRAAQLSSYSPQGHQYENNTAKYYQTPQSYASSSPISVPCPEGPEHEDPNLHITNTYLPLRPDIGLNEAQHQRSASIRSNMSYQLLRFLVDQKESLIVLYRRDSIRDEVLAAGCLHPVSEPKADDTKGEENKRALLP